MLSIILLLLTMSMVLPHASILVVARTQAPYIEPKGDAVEGSYVIHFHEGHTFSLHASHVGKDITQEDGIQYFDFLPGYHARLDDRTLHDLVRYDPGVKFVEHDFCRSADDIDPDGAPFTDDFFDDSTSEGHDQLFTRGIRTKVETKAYNLAMVGAGKKLKDPKSHQYYPRIFLAGLGVRIYVLDSGMMISHKYFQGRADLVPYGHGTHVAGTIGAIEHGVAPLATLVNVKVLNATKQGVDTAIASAIHDVILEHNAYKMKKRKNGWRGSVINMSFGGNYPATYLHNAIIAARAAGITLVAAAGNKNVDSKNTYPCAYPEVICVGSVDSNYNKSSFSNYGSTVNVLAPGRSIPSTSNIGNNRFVKFSGTSMASPHIAGMLAIWVGREALYEGVRTAMNRLGENALWDICNGWDADTWNVFATTGINHPNRGYFKPYAGAPWSGGQEKAVLESSAGVNLGSLPNSEGFWTTSTTTVDLPKSMITSLTTTEGGRMVHATASQTSSYNDA